MPYLICPIVGSHFRPPAKQLLTVLPLGCGLLLRPEPDNPYDENAVQVLVSITSTFPISRWAELGQALDGTGFEPQDLVREEKINGPLQLGYIPRSGTKTAKGGPGNVEVLQVLAQNPVLQATLTTLPDGSPAASIYWAPAEAPQA